MPTFQVHVINSDFASCDDLEAEHVEEARQEGLKAALGIGAEHVCNGTSFFGAEVRVEQDGKVLDRLVVSIGQSPLNGDSKKD